MSRGPNRIVLSANDFVFPVEGRRVDEGIEAMLCCWLQQLQEFGGPEVDKPDLLMGSIGSLKNLGLATTTTTSGGAGGTGGGGGGGGGGSATGTVQRVVGNAYNGGAGGAGGAGSVSGSGSLSKHRHTLDMRARYNVSTTIYVVMRAQSERGLIKNNKWKMHTDVPAWAIIYFSTIRFSITRGRAHSKINPVSETRSFRLVECKNVSLPIG